MKRTLPFVALLVVAVASRPTQGQPRAPDDAHVMELFRQGRALMDEQRYVDAIAAFRRVLAARESAGALFNLGLSLRALNRCREATTAFERSLVIDADRDRRHSAEVNLRELQGCVATLRLEVRGQPSEVRVDGNPIEWRASAATLSLDPGEHVVEASREGFEPVREQVSLRRGGERSLTLDAAARPLQSTLVIEPNSAEAGVRLDDRDLGAGPQRVALPAGPHVVVVRYPGTGGTQRRAVTLQPGVRLVVNVSPDTVRVTSEGGVLTRWWFWTTVSVVAAGAVVGVLAATGAFDYEGPAREGSWGSAVAAIRWP